MEHTTKTVKQHNDSCATLFCDSDFPPSKQSLYENPDDPDNKDRQWMRPREISKKPQMFVNGAHRGDVQQGDLGDCWFLSACSAIAQIPELINKVIPPNQVLDGKGYTGKLKFNFWSMGEWETVEIDDRLPVDDDEQLVYSRCTAENEFWLPLLEKAFAKFQGNYEILEGGHLVEGFVNLTGFFVENVIIANEDKNELYRRLRVERKHKSLLTCSRASQYTQGLVGDHGYTITDLKRITYEGKLLRMVRVRNPWGYEEWTGAWSDGDSRWHSLDKEVKKELGYNRADDGEFWMKFVHFTTRFLEVCIATVVPAVGASRADGTANKMFVIHDSWRAGVNAGGSQNDVRSFATNPQYLLSVEEEDDPESEYEEDSEEGKDKSHKKTCHVLMDLMQEHRRRRQRDLYFIALFVIKCPQTRKDERLTVSELQETVDVVASTDYDSISSVMLRLELDVGEKYVLIPATFEPNQERKFLLRVFSRKPVKVRELLP
ncbi:calpain-9 [Anabrus simplex]|uniref:calpain-9 n=1 Tax=Anabrus simplex TaxID=316456 RepID=UPI0035A30E4A